MLTTFYHGTGSPTRPQSSLVLLTGWLATCSGNQQSLLKQAEIMGRLPCPPGFPRVPGRRTLVFTQQVFYLQGLSLNYFKVNIPQSSPPHLYPATFLPCSSFFTPCLLDLQHCCSPSESSGSLPCALTPVVCVKSPAFVIPMVRTILYHTREQVPRTCVSLHGVSCPLSLFPVASCYLLPEVVRPGTWTQYEPCLFHLK